MEEYVGKNQLKRELHSLFKYESFPIADIEQIIDCLPVMPKHGHWIDTGSGQECSVCGEIQYGYDSYRNYCANCGAKMDEKVE